MLETISYVFILALEPNDEYIYRDQYRNWEWQEKSET